MPRVLRASLAALALLAGAVTVTLTASELPARAAGPSFTFNGGGWGHGLGMSQYGALGAANQGVAYDQILTTYYAGTSVASVSSQPVPQVHLGNAPSMKVAIPAGSTANGGVGFYVANKTSSGGYALSFAFGSTGASSSSGDSVTITDTGTDSPGRYHLAGSLYPGADLGLSTSFIYVQVNANPVTLDLTGHRYKLGSLAFADDGTGSMDGVNGQLDMQSYLYGLGEVPSSWPSAALQAQATAGRSYAANKIGRSACKPGVSDVLPCWNIDGSTFDQVFVGYDKVASGVPYAGQWQAAVDTTNTMTVLNSGSPIQAFYESSSGGSTDTATYVWGGAGLPYIQHVDDSGWDSVSANPNYRWSKTLDGDQLGAMIGGGVGQVQSISIGTANVGVSGRINRATVTVSGSTGTTTITGSQLAARIGLKSTLVFSVTGVNQPPFGNFDAAVGGPAWATVQGWAIDPNTPSQGVEIDVWADGAFAGYGYANQYRSDLASAFPSYGGYHGFSISVPLSQGNHSVCPFAIDTTNPSWNTPLGCRTVSVVDHPPFGNYEGAVRVPGGVSAQGWAIDPDTTGPIEIDAWVDGAFAGYGSADRPRSDVAQAFPGYGPNHGFDFPVNVPVGTHTMCVYAIDYGGSSNTLLSCSQLTLNGDPFGNLDLLTRSGTSAIVHGWAIDPDTASGIEIDVLVDGTFGGWGAADRPRPDVGQVFPRYGPNHGFDFTVPIGSSPRTVCVYAINVGAGVNTNLGCVTI